MKRFLRSLRYAGEGIAYVLRTQGNARIHAGISVAVIILAVLFRISAPEWAVLLLTMGFVFASEMINTVAEMAVDMLVQHRHPMAKAAKDVGAGAVLVAAVAAIGVGVFIFGPRLWLFLAGP